MTQLKIATFNTEWMVLLFGGQWKNWQAPTIPVSFAGGSIAGVKQAAIPDVHGLCRRIAGVIRSSQAHIIGIQEAPPLKEQMEAFVQQFLQDEYVVFHSNSVWQSVSMLVHRSVAAQVFPWGVNPNTWKKIPFYPWGKITAADRKLHNMQRQPLLVRFRLPTQEELGLMVMHTKSKFSLLKTKQQWEVREPEAVLDALEARAKLSGEIRRARQFLDGAIAAPETPGSIVLMGDFNDGPFAELMEEEFMLHNCVDELAGSLIYPDNFFRHAMTPDTLRTASTTRFNDPLSNGAVVEELIDHMLVSPFIWQGLGSFHLVPNSCQVETEIYQNHCAPQGSDDHRDRRPSDHKPVSLVIEY
jgi:endonuclease/exonuclease/phosphatase family metal-dependent hydrolase